MKDQNSIHVDESPDEKWNRGLDLYIESVHKPDNHLRGCAHNQECFNELMEWRQKMREFLSRRGFDYEIISEVIEEMMQANNDHKD